MRSNRGRWTTAKEQLIRDKGMCNKHVEVSQTPDQDPDEYPSQICTGERQKRSLKGELRKISRSGERQSPKKNGFKLVGRKDDTQSMGERQSPKKNGFKLVGRKDNTQSLTPAKNRLLLAGRKDANRLSTSSTDNGVEDTIKSKEYRIYKLVLVGDAGVGKSSLLLQLADQAFTETYLSTIGVDFRVKTIEVNGKIIKMQIWDTAGQERFRTITTTYYRGAHGVVVMFDVTKIDTFHNIKEWLSAVDRYGEEKISKVLVGNKTDLVELREVNDTVARSFAEAHNIPYIETSAKTAKNLDEAFITLVEDIYIRQPKAGHYKPEITLIPSQRTKRNCCS